MQRLKLTIIIMLIMTLTGCITYRVYYHPDRIRLPSSGIGIAPFINNTSTPQVNQSAQSMVAALLEVKGANHIKTYQSNISCQKLLTCIHLRVPINKIQQWARSNQLRYIIYGTVNEWRYKVGLDGEPSVSLTVTIRDTNTNTVIWSSIGSESGSSRSGLGVLAQKLITDMFYGVSINHHEVQSK